MIVRAGLVAALAAGIALASGCAAKREPAISPAGAETIGVYRGQAWDDRGRRTRFRLLLHARLPDGIHAQWIPPVGGPAWILDAGEGRLSLAVIAEKRAYVGPASAAAVARLLGVSIAPPEFVRALLAGEAPGGALAVVRTPAAEPGLPLMFELRDGARGFRLDRTKLETAATRGLATGTPPAGFEVVPIEDLAIEPGYD